MISMFLYGYKDEHSLQSTNRRFEVPQHRRYRKLMIISYQEHNADASERIMCLSILGSRSHSWEPPSADNSPSSVLQQYQLCCPISSYYRDRKMAARDARIAAGNHGWTTSCNWISIPTYRMQDRHRERESKRKRENILYRWVSLTAQAKYVTPQRNSIVG